MSFWRVPIGILKLDDGGIHGILRADCNAYLIRLSEDRKRTELESLRHSAVPGLLMDWAVEAQPLGLDRRSQTTGKLTWDGLRLLLGVRLNALNPRLWLLRRFPPGRVICSVIEPKTGNWVMAKRRKVYARVSGSRMQNQDIWSLIQGDDGETLVLHERLCREKGEKKFSLVEERRMSVREAMSGGGKLAKNLWYAMPQ